MEGDDLLRVEESPLRGGARDQRRADSDQKTFYEPGV